MSGIWHFLNIHSLANSCAFGLEYYMLGNFEKAKPLLMKGIEFCDMIEKGNLAITQEAIDFSQLDAWEDMQILVKCKSADELKAIVEESASIKIDLEKMIQENPVFTRCRIRDMQKFFNDSSDPYLRKANSFLRRSQKIF